jgi:hypothetical protein
MKRTVLGFAALLCCSAALATAWERYEVKDEMRGSVSHGASLRAKASDEPDVSLTMQMIDEGEKEQGIVLQLAGARAACDKNICDVNVRFDGGSVLEQSMAFNSDRTTAIPTTPSAFAGAVGLSSVVFIEMPVVGRSPIQFKFEVEGAPFPRVKTPSFNFAGIALGGSAANISPDFKVDPAVTTHDCREAKDVAGLIPGVTVKSVRMCFYKDMLSSMFIETIGKKDFDAVSKLLDTQLGKRDAGGFFQHWPASTGKVLDMRAVSAVFWPGGKVKGVGSFFITDESISYLIPKKLPAN